MIFATDVEGTVFSFSEGGERILGYSGAEVAGRPARDLAAAPASLDRLLKDAGVSGSAGEMDFAFRHRNGSLVSCNVSLVSLNNRLGERVGTVGICKDITGWKKVQEELVQMQRLAEIGRLAAGIAHEINNPLAIIHEIAGWGQAVASEGKPGELQKAFEDIRDQTKRCRAITHQLLGFVRDSQPNPVDFDLKDLVAKTLVFLKAEIDRAGVQVEKEFPREELTLRSDPRMLEQVMVNLLANAVDAIAEKGEKSGLIRVRLRRDSAQVEIEVQDNGTGIPDENRGRVFDLLFTTKAPGRGTGLGLPICRNIVKNLGGEILFRTESGSGSTFVVRLPA
jgi:two-component system NtrC family sensor kinase